MTNTQGNNPIQRTIKFRAWYQGKMTEVGTMSYFTDGTIIVNDELVGCKLMQFTGLKDKNGLQEVYEGDIIDEYGNIKGNTYEMDAGEADFIVQGFGDKNWGATYEEAVGRGCTDTQRYADKDEVRKLE
jgi:hypothetical protein